MSAPHRVLLDPAKNPRGARRLIVATWAALSVVSVAGALARSPDALRASITVADVASQHVFVIQNNGDWPWRRARLTLDDRWYAESPDVEPGTAWRLIGGDLVDLRAAPLALVDEFYASATVSAPPAGGEAARLPTRRPPPLDAPPQRATLTVGGRTLTLDVPAPAAPASAVDEP